MEVHEEKYVATTRPIIPPYSEHPIIATKNAHVIARPFEVGDLDAFHELRTQIDVMKWTSTTKVDVDRDYTRTWMNRFMDIEEELQHSSDKNVSAQVKSASNSSRRFNFAIVYRQLPLDTADGNTSSEKVIGAGGCHVLEPEPEVGYMIRKEYWGQGIATAFLEAFLTAYWALKREVIRVPANSITDPERRASIDTARGSGNANATATLPEVLMADIVATNTGSRRVLEKSGFQYRWSEPIEENGTTITLEHWLLERP